MLEVVSSVTIVLLIDIYPGVDLRALAVPNYGVDNFGENHLQRVLGIDSALPRGRNWIFCVTGPNAVSPVTSPVTEVMLHILVDLSVSAIVSDVTLYFLETGKEADGVSFFASPKNKKGLSASSRFFLRKTTPSAPIACRFSDKTVVYQGLDGYCSTLLGAPVGFSVLLVLQLMEGLFALWVQDAFSEYPLNTSKEIFLRSLLPFRGADPKIS